MFFLLLRGLTTIKAAGPGLATFTLVIDDPFRLLQSALYLRAAALRAEIEI
jgi:hypothetical protein